MILYTAIYVFAALSFHPLSTQNVILGTPLLIYSTHDNSLARHLVESLKNRPLWNLGNLPPYKKAHNHKMIGYNFYRCLRKAELNETKRHISA